MQAYSNSMKKTIHFWYREFSGFFWFAGGICSFKAGIPGGLTKYQLPVTTLCMHTAQRHEWCYDAFQFFDKCQELCLFQHAHESTRFRNDQRPSCLDYVFTDEDNLVQDLQYRSPLGKSDHVVLTWKIAVHAEELKSHLNKYNCYETGPFPTVC